MTATAKVARLSERTRATQAKPRLRAVRRKVLDVDPAQLNRGVQVINRADKRDDWFDFLRHIERACAVATLSRLPPRGRTPVSHAPRW